MLRRSLAAILLIVLGAAAGLALHEFTHDEKAGLPQVRSASRLGRRDHGVNRARVEALRSRIEKRVAT